MLTGAQGADVASAGLNVLSGVFGYLASREAAAAAGSRADMIRMEAEANAQRYSEMAQAHEAQMAVTYLASGVRLTGSPIDAIDKQKLIARENVDAILMQGEASAFDERTQGANAQARGRNALIGGLSGATRSLAGFGRDTGGGGGTTTTGYAARTDYTGADAPPPGVEGMV